MRKLSINKYTNCIREHQQKILLHSAECLSESVKKGKLVLGNTGIKHLSHLVLAIGDPGFE